MAELKITIPNDIPLAGLRPRADIAEAFQRWEDAREGDSNDEEFEAASNLIEEFVIALGIKVEEVE